MLFTILYLASLVFSPFIEKHVARESSIVLRKSGFVTLYKDFCDYIPHTPNEVMIVSPGTMVLLEKALPNQPNRPNPPNPIEPMIIISSMLLLVSRYILKIVGIFKSSFMWWLRSLRYIIYKIVILIGLFPITHMDTPKETVIVLRTPNFEKIASHNFSISLVTSVPKLLGAPTFIENPMIQVVLTTGNTEEPTNLNFILVLYGLRYLISTRTSKSRNALKLEDSISKKPNFPRNRTKRTTDYSGYLLTPNMIRSNKCPKKLHNPLNPKVIIQVYIK